MCCDGEHLIVVMWVIIGSVLSCSNVCCVGKHSSLVMCVVMGSI